MSYRKAMGLPAWTFDASEMEKFAANFGDTHSIATQEDWDTFRAGMTADDVAAAVKGMLGALTCEP